MASTLLLRLALALALANGCGVESSDGAAASDTTAATSTTGACGTYDTPALAEVELAFENTGDEVLWIAALSCGSSFRLAGPNGPIDWTPPPLGAPCDRSCVGVAAGLCSIAPECGHACEASSLGLGVGGRVSSTWRGTTWTTEPLPETCDSACAELYSECWVEHAAPPGTYTLSLEIQTGVCSGLAGMPCCEPRPGGSCSVYGGSVDGERRTLEAQFELPGTTLVELAL